MIDSMKYCNVNRTLILVVTSKINSINTFINTCSVFTIYLTIFYFIRNPGTFNVDDPDTQYGYCFLDNIQVRVVFP